MSTEDPKAKAARLAQEMNRIKVDLSAWIVALGMKKARGVITEEEMKAEARVEGRRRAREYVRAQLAFHEHMVATLRTAMQDDGGEFDGIEVPDEWPEGL